MNEEKRRELEELSELFDEYIDDEAYKDRPKRYDSRYVKIENISDYEYTYVLAYILSQKNEKVREHFKKAKHYEENLAEYVDTLNITDFYKDSINLGYGGFLEEKENSPESNLFFEIVDSNLTINDIQKFDHDLDVEHIGLWKLISYLIDTNNLYICNNDSSKETSLTLTLEQCRLINIFEAEKRINDIMQNPHNYAANCKYNGSDKLKLTTLSKDMPLEMLDVAFLKDLNIIRTRNKIPNAKINYSVPTLTFKDSNVVNFPINLNLDKEELVAYISKIKDDFDERKKDDEKDTVKSTLEIFGEKLEDAKKPKSENILPKKRTKDNLLNPKWKMAVADAFYIYDLYKYIEEIYNENKRNNRKFATNDIHIDVALASGISKVHNDMLKDGILGHDNDLQKSNRLEKYYKIMREYIKDEKYKELITGSEAKDILGMWDRVPTSPVYSITVHELSKKNFGLWN